ncbi:MAG: ABC transporter ATP-binding protein [Saprospiraceae bacterium]|uniref:ABC transporter ATP-binding protein n=1 Tax=Candidatus Opimibacter skivensis TaxID=2982028 RepID=A0A9D7XSP1_9BACT|nr:ABC transporter ATP-binding protein [Candidatus Opimibacter skivensis]
MEAIIIEHLWKTYQRGKSRRGDIRQSLTFWWNNLKSGHEYFNALEDINLRINEGDVVGIIGPNGAGKSTLLKILSRITYPSKGKVTINGSLSSLLEVGVGFHPELTGRDNIYLNGAIHGMSKKEIDRKFESIVEFSGLELFLDTPVKQYSSGMYVRLAFSISAHLDTNILLLDEVLGVGDLEFKKKSLQKIAEKLNEGRTIIMVSHQLDVLQSLCVNGLYLDNGKLIKAGPIDSVIETYLTAKSELKNIDLGLRRDRMGSGKAIVSAIRFVDKDGKSLATIHSGQFVKIIVELKSLDKFIQNVDIRLDVFDKMGQQWFLLSNTISDGTFLQCPGEAILECEIPKFPLGEGHYILNASLNINNQKSDFIQQAAEIEVLPGDFYSTGKLPSASNGVLINYHWQVKGE